MEAWREELYHHGIKGQKWGVRRGPPYPLGTQQKLGLDKSGKSGIISIRMNGHGSPPMKSKPFAVIDRAPTGGTVTQRAYYDGKGRKVLEIHADDHGNRKHHSYGRHGEHAHEYIWDNVDRLPRRETRELTKTERKENRDIL